MVNIEKIALILKCEKKIVLNLSDEEIIALKDKIKELSKEDIIPFIKNYISKLYREMGYDLNDIIEDCDIKFI